MAFSDRHKAGQFDRLTAGPLAGKLKLAEQYRAFGKGDVARRMELHKGPKQAARIGHGAAGAHRAGPGPLHSPAYRVHGKVSPHFTANSFRHHYYGHHYFAGLHWYPRWTHWVNWSWYYHGNPYWDPRPVWCRPVIYVTYSDWGWWDCPVWAPLPVVSSGTWVDVPVVRVEQLDLQLLAVRFIDPGHPEEQLGPRYRVWFRNNSNLPITQPMNVMLFASNDNNLAADLPRAGVRVTSIEAGDVQSVDIRLPIEVYGMGPDADGQPTPFGVLHALVDADREIPETLRENNGAILAREDILPVDPAAFVVEPSSAAAGGELLIAGEGFGPQPGRVLVSLAGLELEGEILGWYDLGVRVKLPHLPLAKAAEAELVVIRGDGAAANPLKITIEIPQAAAPQLPPQVPPQLVRPNKR